MDSYNKQYNIEKELFGEPYPEFEKFIGSNRNEGANALDIGCGQGRDALMLAKYGYNVTGIDSSHVGIEQMISKAEASGLTIKGIVADLFEFDYSGKYSVIVLDSILHFQKSDRSKEIVLLNRLLNHLEQGGLLFIFVHKSDQKEKVLNSWIKVSKLIQISANHIDYIYEEKASGFKSSFQMYMTVLKNLV